MSTSADAIHAVAANTAAAGAATTSDQRPTKRVKLLTGAPDPAKLSWDESALLNDWTPAVRRFLKGKFDVDEDEHVRGNDGFDTATTTTASRWRSIPLSRNAHLSTGFTQESPLRKDFLYAPAFAAAEYSFALSNSQTSTASLPTAEDHDHAAVTAEDDDDANEDEGADSQFIEHSIAVHDDTRSSQLALDPITDVSTTSILNSFASITTTTSSSSSSPASFTEDYSSSALPALTLPRTITPLAAIPRAPHLRAIIPQTVVVNLLAGVIALLPARPVRTRRGALRDLVELLVGDETASGFKISFWFAHDEESQERRQQQQEEEEEEEEEEEKGAEAGGGEDPLRRALRGLRVRDVVLVENVALDTFRERVFGYSLRKSMQRNQTAVRLVAREGVDRVGGVAGVERVTRVKEWVWGLVHTTRVGGVEGEGGDEVGAVLPPDTQE